METEKARRVKVTVQDTTVRFVLGKESATHLNVSFIRTLRIPDDGKTYALPAGVGSFPIKKVEDYKTKVPAAWNEHGGVFIPLWQREALWLSFGRSALMPWALKVAAGKINAVTGEVWDNDKLVSAARGDEYRVVVPSSVRDGAAADASQNYIVAPPQPWLDGFNAGNGTIRQFVAMPLGMGYTVEGQVTGKEEFGGIQLQAFPPTQAWLDEQERKRKEEQERRKALLSADHPNSRGLQVNSVTRSRGVGGASAGPQHVYSSTMLNAEPQGAATMDFMSQELPRAAEMGLAQGGKMTQKIYADPHGLGTWDQEIRGGRVYVHIVNSEMYKQITGEEAPASPIDKAAYARAGYKWFDLYDEGIAAVGASTKLSGAKSVDEMDKKHGFVGMMDNGPIVIPGTVKLSVETVDKDEVVDGKW